MSLFNELKRRNVFRVAIAYLIAAWLLIQLADILIPMLDLPEWVARLILLLLLILFVPTLIAAWALEMTPEGLKLEKNVDRDESITPHTGKKLNAITIGVLALAVFVLLVDKMYLSADSSTDEIVEIDKSIAVLPFVDLSQSQDQEWFADGLAEEILNALARTPDLLVASRTSAFAYKGSTKDLRVIADELDVAHILEGSVRRAGERLRVTAQLIRASDGFHLWSENYDRDAADVIDVQEDLAIKIAGAMKTTMDPAALKDMLSVGTRSVEAYQAYLRGISMNAESNTTGDDDDFIAAYELFELARHLDPDFSSAHEKAAFFWINQSDPTSTNSGLTKSSRPEINENYIARIELAIKTAGNNIDRQHYEAQEALFEMRFRRALRLYEKYLQDRPNDLGARYRFMMVAQYLSDRQSVVTSLEHFKHEGASQTLAAQFYINHAYRVIDVSDAADYALATLQRWPDNNGLLYQAHRTLFWARRPEEAASVARHYEDIFGFNLMIQARQACMEGRVQDVVDILEAELADDNIPNNIRWLLYLLLDDKEAAAEIPLYYESIGATQVLASWLIYHKFDPSPYPSLVTLLERENVNRPPAVEMPYTCPVE